MGAAASLVTDRTVVPLGVELSYLNEFISTECSEVDLSTATTTEVVDKIIRPISEHSKLSICELGQQQEHSKVGFAQVFVSHWWGARFIDTVNALNYMFRATPNVIIWIDIFSCSLHRELTEERFPVFCSNLKKMIEDMHHMVLVVPCVKEWRPLRRLWCLFECMCAIESCSKIEFALTEEQSNKLFNLVKKDSRFILSRLYEAINLDTSRCSEDSDQRSLYGMMSENPSRLQGMEISIAQAMTRVLIEMISNKLECFSDDDTVDETVGNSPRQEETPTKGDEQRPSLGADDKEVKASELTEEALEEKRKEAAAEARQQRLDRAYMSRGLGLLLLSMSRISESADLLASTLKTMKEELGVNHNETLKTTLIFAELLFEQRQYDKAEALCKEVIATFKRNTKVHPKDIIDGMTVLARIFEAQEKTEEADKMYAAVDFICGKYFLQYKYFSPQL